MSGRPFDDPYAEIGGGRTFIKITPDPRASETDVPRPSPTAWPEVSSDIESIESGLNPLVAIANRLLALVTQIRGTPHLPDPAALRDSLAAYVRVFESQARTRGIASERVLAARYVLCTVLDEAATSTPWGGGGKWGRHSLLAMFHNETGCGEKVFQLMSKLVQQPAANRDLLELIYAALSIGFEGRYRVTEGGAAQLEAVRERLAQIVRKERGDYGHALAQRWRSGLPKRSAFLTWLPLWLTATLCALLLAGSYLYLSLDLARKSDPPWSRTLSLKSEPVAEPQRQATPTPRLAPHLQAEVQAGQATVHDDLDRSVITLRNDELFAPPSAIVAQGRVPLFGQLASALASVSGTVIVTGWVVLGTIVALILLRLSWRTWTAHRTNATMVAQLAAAPSVPSNDPADAEIAVLQQRFTDALAQLSQVRFANYHKGIGGAWSDFSARLVKRYLYKLPWYVIIGAPGSGKTTLLINSGLHFPLSATTCHQSVRGAGGTHNCDWWFTGEAVLIDTAGRYTTQTSDVETDSKAWQAFLQLLRRSRPRQPLSGLIVTVSVPDLLMQSAAERSTHAQAIRRRVQELHQQLCIRFPIYLLVTKSDLLSGFTDYLGDIDKDVCATPWGFTFKHDAEQRSDIRAFDAEFGALEKRLQDGLFDRLQSERDAHRRARIYAFPQQFAGLRDVLLEFTRQVFSPSQFERHPLLRGIYFVSGTQEGTPIDRMLGRLSRSFGLVGDSTAATPGQGKSFFVTRLLREVIFEESGLSGTDLKANGALARWRWRWQATQR